MPRTRRALAVLLLAGLLGMPGSPPALADHGESSMVLGVYPEGGADSAVSTYGQMLQLAAIVSDSSFSCLSTLNDCDPPSGTVDFYRGEPGAEVHLGQAGHDFITRRDSAFILEYCCLPAGTHTLLAIYNPQADGGGNHFIPSSARRTHTVQKATPQVLLHQSTSATTLGQPVTFTATLVPVSAAAGSPTGTVQFSAGGSPIGGPVPLAGTQAVLTTSALPPGTHTVRAQYSGDANHLSVGAEVTHAVRDPSTSVSLSSSPNPSSVGQAVLLRAAVAAADGVTPTGSVTFRNGGTALGTVPLAGGVAELSVSSLPAGNHSLTAAYGGDATHGPSTSAPLVHTVRALASTTTLTSSPNPSLPGQAVVLQAQVSGAGGATPSGTVTFRDGSTVLGASPLSGGAASLTVSSLAVGSHPLTAAYSGDATYMASTSAAVSHSVVRHPTSTQLTSTANPSVPGQPVTFQAVVATAGTPTGTVTFKDGGATLGTATLAGGVARLTTSALAVGSHSITAAYNGDATHAPSTSGPLPQTVRGCTIVAPSTGGFVPGTAGNDVICGSAAADDIAGMGGDDLIVGFGGNDRLGGGEGNDVVFGGDGDDQLSGGGGSDRLVGDGGSDTAAGGDGVDACSAETVGQCEPAPAV